MMLATSVYLIAWLMGFLFIFSGLGKSQQIQYGVLTVDNGKRMAFTVGLIAYLVFTLVLSFILII